VLYQIPDLYLHAIVRPTLLSAPETLDNGTDSHIQCRRVGADISCYIHDAAKTSAVLIFLATVALLCPVRLCFSLVNILNMIDGGAMQLYLHVAAATAGP